MSVFFADTFYWIALTNPRDAAHRAVMEFTAKLGPRVVLTTDEVLIYEGLHEKDQALQ